MTGPLERLDASAYGDPDDHQPAAPPCRKCGRREALDPVHGLCRECARDRDQTPPGSGGSRENIAGGDLPDIVDILGIEECSRCGKGSDDDIDTLRGVARIQGNLCVGCVAELHPAVGQEGSADG